MSWFVKNAFNNVYPCISKIWTVSKLKLLITCQESQSWFVKYAFYNVYPCISKIWTVSKLKLLIAWLANTNCVDQSPLQRATLYTHLQIVNYRWFKMFIWFETKKEKNKQIKLVLIERTLSAYKESFKNNTSAKKNVGHESGLSYTIILSLTMLNVSFNSLKAYCFKSAYCYASLQKGAHHYIILKHE